MGVMRSVLIAVTVMVAAMEVSSFACSTGDQYTVGGSFWTIPQTPDYYNNWSSSYEFKIGDSLLFNYETSHYDVMQVSRQEYESCTACNPYEIYGDSPAVFPLKEKGTFYFICNVSNYCDLGMKMSIAVHECSSQRPPTTSPPSPSPKFDQHPISSPKSSSLPPRSAWPSPEPAISPAPLPYDGNGHSPENGSPADKSMGTRGRLMRINGGVIGLIVMLFG